MTNYIILLVYLFYFLLLLLLLQMDLNPKLTNNIYGIYKDYYERTLLNATTLEILELQILEILSKNRYLFPTLLHR